MKLDYKVAGLVDVKAEGDGNVITGYASTFGNKDDMNDIVMPGAFAKTLKKRLPKMLFNHDRNEIIGIWEEASEDSKGLKVKGKIFTSIQKGAEVLELVKEKAIDSMSIGFRTIVDELDHATGARKLKQVDLFEVSLVTFAANNKATISSVKSLDGNELLGLQREFSLDGKTVHDREVEQLLSQFKWS